LVFYSPLQCIITCLALPVKLIVAPFPDKQRGSDQFFFQAFSKSPLTTAIQA
jgi:hypothetical protein